MLIPVINKYKRAVAGVKYSQIHLQFAQFFLSFTPIITQNLFIGRRSVEDLFPSTTFSSGKLCKRHRLWGRSHLKTHQRFPKSQNI